MNYCFLVSVVLFVVNSNCVSAFTNDSIQSNTTQSPTVKQRMLLLDDEMFLTPVSRADLTMNSQIIADNHTVSSSVNQSLFTEKVSITDKNTNTQIKTNINRDLENVTNLLQNLPSTTKYQQNEIRNYIDKNVNLQQELKQPMQKYHIDFLSLFSLIPRHSFDNLANKQTQNEANRVNKQTNMLPTITDLQNNNSISKPEKTYFKTSEMQAPNDIEKGSNNTKQIMGPNENSKKNKAVLVLDIFFDTPETLTKQNLKNDTRRNNKKLKKDVSIKSKKYRKQNKKIVPSEKKSNNSGKPGKIRLKSDLIFTNESAWFENNVVLFDQVNEISKKKLQRRKEKKRHRRFQYSFESNPADDFPNGQFSNEGNIKMMINND